MSWGRSKMSRCSHEPFRGVIFLLLTAVAIVSPISPKMAQISPFTAQRVTCNHDSTPLDKCQFSLWNDSDYDASPRAEIMDFSRGTASQKQTRTNEDDDVVFKVAYVGRDLVHGDCGVTLSEMRDGRYFVGCRVHVVDKEWKYDFMALVVRSSDSWSTKLQETTTPFLNQTVGHRRDSRPFVFTAPGRLHECRVYLPGYSEFRLNKDSQGNRGSPRVENRDYRGTLEGRECAATMLRLESTASGLVWVLYREVGSRSWLAFPPQIVIVRESPDSGTLVAVPNPNGSFVVQCSVPSARPPARLRWTLDGRVVREDDDVDDDVWAWPWEARAATQRLTIRVSAGEAVTVACHLFHPDRDTEMLPAMSAVVRGRRELEVSPVAAASDDGCLPLTPHSMSAHCSLGAVKVDCAEVPVPRGTVARLQCRPGFKPRSGKPNSVTVSCAATGWRPRPAPCEPDCGVRGASKSTLIAGGEDAAVGEFPWHVGIYRSLDDDTYTQDCGGTLISRTIVITAAHCFWSESLRTMKPHSLYKVAAGKHLRDWSQREAKMQVRDVANISVPARFRGRSSNFQYDIAVVRLDTGFELTSAVSLVCMDWTKRLEATQLAPGVSGTVAGWGATGKTRFSDVLQKASLPYVDFATCFDSLSDHTEKLYTDDKFCAGVANQSRSVCPGDSGGGLVFATRDNRYYLRGVVSVSFKPAHFIGSCYAEHYTGFTLVSNYLAWIKPLVDS